MIKLLYDYDLITYFFKIHFKQTVTNVSNVCTNNHNHYGEEEEEDEDDDDDDASKGEYVDEECRNGNEVDEEDDYPWNLTKAVLVFYIPVILL